jgi:Tol biopolymer transport system component/DNA-binding winged helix-turn-helix (wHTH) protein
MILRFDDFELDTAECRLSRGGQAIRLEKLPLDLLIFLAQRPQELVNRQALAGALWGDSAYVDAEHGINTAIRKIRTALGDSPTEPRYIETVVRRGYRFRGTLLEDAPPPQIAPVAEAGERGGVHGKRIAVGVLATVLAAIAVYVGSTAARPRGLPKLAWRALTKPARIHTNHPLASDGRFVYWTEYDENGCRPLRAPLDGGDPAPAPMPFANAYVLDASADGHLLLNVRDDCKNMDFAGALWEIDRNGENARRVGELTAHAASYSPDGRRLALAVGTDLWVANADGSGARRIADTGTLIYIVRWSPGGEYLRFSSGNPEESRYTLLEARVDGKELRDLLAGRKDISSRWGGAWSSAGGGFIFEATRQGATDLWRIAGAGGPVANGAPEQVTEGPLDYSAPTSIPGRSDLLVVGSRKRGMLKRYDVKGQQFAPYLGGLSAEMVDFSRDGAWIAYVTYPDGELWRSRADGSERLQLTKGPMRAGLPRISPDGRQIAFSAEQPGQGFRVYVIPFDGGNPRLATAAGKAATEVAPTWSADGKSLLFRYSRTGGQWMMEDNLLQTVDLASQVVRTVPGSNLRFNQRWSPDGRWLVATPNDEGELDLYDFASGRWSVLVKMKADYPSISADGRYVYFAGNTKLQGAAIYRVSVSTRQAEFVASLADSERAIDDTWGQWVGLTPDGAPLILANADLQQIYLLSFSEK